MPDEQPTTPSAPAAVSMAAMTGSPGALLTLSAALLMGGWLIFDVLLGRDSSYWVTLVVAAIVLWARWRPSGLAEPLARPFGTAVLAAVIFFYAAFALVYQVRQAIVPDAIDLLAAVVFYVAGAVAGLAWWNSAR